MSPGSVGAVLGSVFRPTRLCIRTRALTTAAASSRAATETRPSFGPPCGNLLPPIERSTGRLQSRSIAAKRLGVAHISTGAGNIGTSSSSDVSPGPSRTDHDTRPSDSGLDVPEALLGGAEVEAIDLTTDLELPVLPLPRGSHLKHRNDPVIHQITRLLMRDGKLSKAERNMGMILNYLRTAPPPKLSSDTPLLPTAPPAANLPLDPAEYLKVVVDSVAPLMKTRGFPGLAGGGRALPIPMPLRTRQRRRRAVLWMLEAVEKRPSKGSGKKQFAHRFAEEVVAIAEGRSKVWDKRAQLHREVTLLRANSNHPGLRKLKNVYGGI